MEHLFQTKIDNELQDKIVLFLTQQSAAIEQYPGWYDISGNCHPVLYYIGMQNNSIVCYATIIEPESKIAIIEFGPVFSNRDDALCSLKEIARYYKRKFIGLKIQLFTPIGTDSEFIYQNLALNQKIIHYVNKNENWSTLQVDLSVPGEDIFKNFSKGHKSAIKKAQKQGLYVKEISDIESINQFIRIFVKMHESRSLHLDSEIHSIIPKIFNFLNEKGIGCILAVYNADNTMIGGIILIKQGKMVRYFKGAADPECRNFPVLHCALYEGILKAKQWGATIFDFWGYCLLADENDQRFNINVFKKGFGGELIIYPKTMYLLFNRFYFFIYKKIYATKYKKIIRDVLAIFIRRLK